MESITDRDNSMLVATCIRWKSTLSTLLHIATHCDCDATKAKAVTIIAEQRTWLKVLEQTHWNLVTNLYGPNHTKTFVNIIFVRSCNYENYENFLLRKFGGIQYDTINLIQQGDSIIQCIDKQFPQS